MVKYINLFLVAIILIAYFFNRIQEQKKRSTVSHRKHSAKKLAFISFTP